MTIRKFLGSKSGFASNHVVFAFLAPHLLHMEIPRLGVERELLLPAYATATATWVLAVSVTYTTAHGNTSSLTH